MRFIVLTLFPGSIDSFLQESILLRAQKAGHIEVEAINIRDFSTSKHKKVDDAPFGGGAGMLMMCEPLFLSIEHAKTLVPKDTPVIYFSPQGKKLTQSKVEQFSKKHQAYILLCGHYEGIDQRVKEALIDIEISVGDYILTGGEIPACLFIDAVSRLIPQVLGKESSHQEESFSKSLGRKKEYPQYTRPEEFRGMKVPKILLSGDHKKISQWKKDHLQ